MAQVECDAQSHGCGPDAGTIDGTLVLLDLGMKKGFRTPPKTLTVEPGIPGVCRYFAVFSVYHDIGCLAAHPALVGPLSRLSFVRIPLFSEKVTMGARSGQSEHQHVLLYEIDQQQVWCDMALPEAGHIACKRMVMIPVGQCAALGQNGYNLFEKVGVQSASSGEFEVLPESGRGLDRVPDAAHASKSLNKAFRSR